MSVYSCTNSDKKQPDIPSETPFISASMASTIADLTPCRLRLLLLGGRVRYTRNACRLRVHLGDLLTATRPVLAPRKGARQ